MDKEFIEEVKKDIEWTIKHHRDQLINENGTINDYHHGKLKIYSFIERVLDSVLKPLERFIPEKQEEETQKNIGEA